MTRLINSSVVTAQQTGLQPSDEHSASPALSHQNTEGPCPATAYLISQQSPEGRRVMTSRLYGIARIAGERSNRTVRTYQDFDWRKLTRVQMQAIMSVLVESGLSPATVNGYRSALRGVAKESWALGYLSHEQYQHCLSVKPARGSRLNRQEILDDDDVRRLLRVCSSDASEIGVRDLAMLGMMLGTGVRRSEVTGLTMSDLNRVTGELKVLGKGNKERMVLLPEITHKWLDCWIDEVRGEAEGPLFCGVRKGGQLTYRHLSAASVWFLLNKRCEEAGLAMFAPHDLRRTFATMLLNGGEDLLVVRDALGHSSVRVTENYIVRDTSRNRAASRKQGERLATIVGQAVGI